MSDIKIEVRTNQDALVLSKTVALNVDINDANNYVAFSFPLDEVDGKVTECDIFYYFKEDKANLDQRVTGTDVVLIGERYSVRHEFINLNRATANAEPLVFKIGRHQLKAYTHVSSVLRQNHTLFVVINVSVYVKYKDE